MCSIVPGFIPCSLLRDYSWQSYRNFIGCQGLKQVSCMQHRCLTHCTNTPALELVTLKAYLDIHKNFWLLWIRLTLPLQHTFTKHQCRNWTVFFMKRLRWEQYQRCKNFFQMHFYQLLNSTLTSTHFCCCQWLGIITEVLGTVCT